MRLLTSVLGPFLETCLVPSLTYPANASPQIDFYKESAEFLLAYFRVGSCGYVLSRVVMHNLSLRRYKLEGVTLLLRLQYPLQLQKF